MRLHAVFFDKKKKNVAATRCLTSANCIAGSTTLVIDSTSCTPKPLNLTILEVGQNTRLSEQSEILKISSII